MIDFSKFDESPAPQGIRAESVVCIEAEPEDANISGWDGPGWYFWDEAYQLHGPFGTKQEASAALSAYCADLGGYVDDWWCRACGHGPMSDADDVCLRCNRRHE